MVTNQHSKKLCVDMKGDGLKGQIGGQKNSFSQVMWKVIVWKNKYGDQWEIPHMKWKWK